MNLVLLRISYALLLLVGISGLFTWHRRTRTSLPA